MKLVLRQLAEWRQWSADELAMRVREEMVKLQRELASEHAEASQRRIEADRAAAAAMPARRRRGPAAEKPA